MEGKILRAKTVASIFLLLVVVSACAVWGESESDAIRRAVITHELDDRGLPVDDLIIRLSPGEFRADFGHGSRVVWLVSPEYQRQYIEGEYFRVHDPERSYLFVQDIAYNDFHDQATVGFVLYLGSGQPAAREITLHKKADSWEVISERPLEAVGASHRYLPLD
jgi:hypothetical protein